MRVLKQQQKQIMENFPFSLCAALQRALCERDVRKQPIGVPHPVSQSYLKVAVLIL